LNREKVSEEAEKEEKREKNGKGDKGAKIDFAFFPWKA